MITLAQYFQPHQEFCFRPGLVFVHKHENVRLIVAQIATGKFKLINVHTGNRCSDQVIDGRPPSIVSFSEVRGVLGSSKWWITGEFGLSPSYSPQNDDTKIDCELFDKEPTFNHKDYKAGIGSVIRIGMSKEYYLICITHNDNKRRVQLSNLKTGERWSPSVLVNSYHEITRAEMAELVDRPLEEVQLMLKEFLHELLPQRTS